MTSKENSPHQETSPAVAPEDFGQDPADADFLAALQATLALDPVERARNLETLAQDINKQLEATD